MSKIKIDGSTRSNTECFILVAVATVGVKG